MRAMVAVGACAAASVTLLFLGCAVGGAWWPLFNVFFFVLGMLPMAFGSHESTGVWGSLGDFLEAVFAVSAFMFPTVLLRVDEGSGVGLFLLYLSNIFAGGTCYLLYRISQESSVW